jgi:TolB-like protein
MSFWGELRRRNVIKVGVAYLVVAWLLAQVVGLVLPTFEAPPWITQTVIFLLILGFPIILIVAWAFEITPDGLRLTASVPKSESMTPVTGQRLNYVVTALLGIAVAFLVVDNYLLDDARETGSSGEDAEEEARPSVAVEESGILPNSVAVIPFTNLSPSEEDAYFAAAIHEEVLNQLAKLSNLSVIARTSVLQYADTTKTIPEIARELNVEAVMEGSVRYAGDSVLVTAQLIDPTTGLHLWSDTYPGNRSDVNSHFEMQADIAMNIANALNVEFSSSTQQRLGRILTQSSEAYGLYLAALAAQGEDRLNLLEQAVAVDSEFAAAYARIAVMLAFSTRDSVGRSATNSWKEVGDRAIENAERALALDPELELAHLARAIIDELSWRWPQAEEGYARAYELNSSDPDVVWAYSYFSAWSGNFPRAVQLAERQLALRPSDPDAYSTLSLALGNAGDSDGAIRACESAILIQPAHLFCHFGLALVHARVGNAELAEMESRLIEQMIGRNRLPALLPTLAANYANIGLDDDVERIVAEIEGLADQTAYGPGAFAVLYVAQRNRERAREWLEVAVANVERGETDPSYFTLMNLKNNLYDVPMLEEPEFVELRQRIGSL